jgi:RNA polymerase sigma-70 factor (ECF subfamily)
MLTPFLKKKGNVVVVNYDEEAISLCKQGKSQGLEFLIQRYQMKAMRVAFLVLGDHTTSEDVVQESFVRAWNAMKDFKDGAAFSPWFMRIVINTAHMHQRTIARHPTTSLGQFTTDDAVFATQTSDPHLFAEQAELRSTIMHALAMLTAVQRTAVVLHYYGGYTASEIAQIVGCREDAARRRIHDGLATLKRIMEQQSSLPEKLHS